ncbi:MAG: hypothetical protein ACXAEB_03800 [Candidatus Thorarchaeota archaeon]|jgi:hypothetical protein
MAIRYRVLCFGFFLVIIGGIISLTFLNQNDWYNLDFGSLLAILIGILITISGGCIFCAEQSAEDVDRFWRRREL